MLCSMFMCIGLGLASLSSPLFYILLKPLQQCVFHIAECVCFGKLITIPSMKTPSKTIVDGSFLSRNMNLLHGFFNNGHKILKRDKHHCIQ